MDNDSETEDTPHTEELDNETQIELNNGCESPVIAQTPKTIQRESGRSCTRKEVVTDILKNIQHIAFTTDAWRSFHKDSYIRITAQVLDAELTLHSFLLDTSEIKDRHTENFYGDEENQTQMFKSQTQIDDSQTVPPSSRSGVHNVIHTGTEHTNTFIRDNASDISKALRKEAGFVWFGCAGHHVNLIVKTGFKKNQTAARLLTKCKNIVKAVNHSQPILYDVQVMTTRWWSILHMLTSILNNSHLLLTEDEKAKIKELIALLKPFKILEK